ncbi:TPA_exp: Uncharacterized protein A8136_1322 [Trichophyton benhamiae CBS 112371]|nr:TPA_exp: Uncharacterized protein A8136_1322 [Trichophyton benhamiae CBS 112371]
MLENLPREIIFSILSKVEDRVDLKCLSEASKQLNSMTAPFLYQSILITTARKANGIINAHERARVLQYTTDIHVAGEDKEKWAHPHDPSAQVDFQNINTRNARGVEDGASTTRDGSLTSTELKDKLRWIDVEPDPRFSRILGYMELRREWDRMDFIPPEILGKEGYLPTRQKSLETLFIRANSGYGCHIYYPHLFTKLKRLSWDNLGNNMELDNAKDDLERLRDCLEVLSHQLVYLELGLKMWEYSFYDSDDDEATISQEIMKPNPGGKRFQFQKLQHLSLTGFNFEYSAVNIVGDLNPATLDTLTIRLCGQEWPNFLDRLNASEPPFRLHTVEILSWEDPESFSSENADIARFVNGCESLQNLYIAVREQDGALELWQALLRHKNTLRTFVYYVDPMVDTREDSSPFCIADVSFSMPQSHKTNPEWNPLRHLDLEFLGVSYDFKYLLPVLAPIANIRSLKVLLIRRSPLVVIGRLKAAERVERNPEGIKNEDEKPNKNFQAFDEFVQWAFGPEGIPSLQMIGIGDFSDSVMPRRKALLCRKSNPKSDEVFPGRNYRFVTRRDLTQQELLQNTLLKSRDYLLVSLVMPDYICHRVKF